MEQTRSKISISLKPPLPNIRVLPSPKSPTIPLSPTALPIKRTSNSKSIQRASAEKSRREKQIERDIKYTKHVVHEAKNEVSFIHSDESAFASPRNHRLEDTQSTLHQVKTPSCERQGEPAWKRSELGERVSQSNRRSSVDKNQDFYHYWKNKAHEYLEANIKLMDQLTALTKQNQELREIAHRPPPKTDNNQPTEKTTPNDQSVSEVRAMSIHYLKKIEEMEKELKRKEIVIISYEIKLKQLNQALVGDKEKAKVISALKDDVFSLKEQNSQLEAELNKFRRETSDKGQESHQPSAPKLKSHK